jgi:hypothetical protein
MSKTKTDFRWLCVAVALVGIIMMLMGGNAEAAQAAPIRECGSVAGVKNLRVKNLTTRNVSCSRGRELVRQYVAWGAPNYIQKHERVTVRGCTTITDVRMVGGEAYGSQGQYTRIFVVHFQMYGSACD